MIKKKKFIVIGGIIAATIIIVILVMYITSRPWFVIENRLNIELPADSKIVNYTYDRDGDYFYVKIFVEKNNLAQLRSQLDTIFDFKLDDYSLEEVPFFANTCPWWDLDIKNVENYYKKVFIYESSIFRTLRARDSWAFISKENDGEYYLYISY